MAVYRRSRKPTYRKKPTMAKAKVSTAVKKYVKKHTPKPEVKRVLDGYAEQQIVSTVTPYSMYEFTCVQGLTKSNRIGTSVKLIGLQVKCYIKNNATTTGLCRVLVLSCPSDTDTAAATMELFKDANSAGDTTVISTSGISPGNVLWHINDNKFKVHSDQVIKLGGTGSLDGRDINIYKKFVKFNTTINYDANSTGVGNQDRRVFLLFLTSESALDSGGGSIELSGNNYWFFTDV